MRRIRKSALGILATVLLGTSAGFDNSASAANSGTWTATGNMHVARESHTATLLTNGEVVVAGGEGSNGVTAASEIYDPPSASWSAVGNLNVARASQGAVLLPSGEILVAGGCTKTCTGGNTATAELYDPATATWSQTGSMNVARVYFGMVLLSNGKVLAVGGCTGQNSNGCTGVTGTAEIYDPASGAWSSVNAMGTARGAFTATLLANGQVLVAGGINAAGN